MDCWTQANFVSPAIYWTGYETFKSYILTTTGRPTLSFYESFGSGALAGSVSSSWYYHCSHNDNVYHHHNYNHHHHISITVTVAHEAQRSTGSSLLEVLLPRHWRRLIAWPAAGENRVSGHHFSIHMRGGEGGQCQDLLRTIR